jgi:hypothetical protein
MLEHGILIMTPWRHGVLNRMSPTILVRDATRETVRCCAGGAVPNPAFDASSAYEVMIRYPIQPSMPVLSLI